MPLISVDSLRREAATYDPVLRNLPAVHLASYVQEMGFNLQAGIDREERLQLLRRKGGMLSAYDGNVATVPEKEGVKFEESVLKVEPVYIALSDNINNYRTKQLVSKAGRQISHVDKRHPLEREILETVISTFSEDIALSLAHAKRGANTGPLGAFDGYNTIIDAKVASGDIAAAKGNLNASDAGADELEKFINWVRKLHPALRMSDVDIYIPQSRFWKIQNAFADKRQYVGETATSALALYTREMGGLLKTPRIITSIYMGDGDRLMACRRGGITVGISAPRDTQFVQIRNIESDPNIVQFWIQADVGTRLDDWHAKTFCIDEGTIQAGAIDLKGDYQ